MFVWIKLFGNSVVAVRLLSVLFSSLAAGVLFLFANKHFNAKTAVYSSALFISSNILFFYAHEARAYSLTVFLAVLATHVFFIALEKKKVSLFILLGLLDFLLIYTHYVTGLLLLYQVVYMLLADRKLLKFMAIGLALTALLVFLRFTKKQFALILGYHGDSANFWLQKSNAGYLKEVMGEFLGNTQVLALIMFALYIVSCVWIFMNRKKLPAAVLSFIMVSGIGSVFILFFAGTLTPIFLDRYILFAVPFMLLIPSFFLSNIKLSFIPAGLLGIGVAFSMIKIDYTTLKSMDYSGAMPLIKDLKNDDMAIIVSTKDIAPLFTYYYSRDAFNSRKYSESLQKENVFFASVASDLPPDMKFKKILHVSSFDVYTDKSIDTFLNEHFFAKVSNDSYKGVKVSLYSNPR
ncbi:MAG: glycosyltransferase family 39 protein [Bacteroidetes bacterium]|nr:glycosyltransferase family 39 protein [Bacteroidota bacterium]